MREMEMDYVGVQKETHSEGFWGDVIGRGQKFTMFYTTKRCANDDIPQQRRTQNKANRLELR